MRWGEPNLARLCKVSDVNFRGLMPFVLLWQTHFNL